VNIWQYNIHKTLVTISAGASLNEPPPLQTAGITPEFSDDLFQSSLSGKPIFIGPFTLYPDL